jgi:hypothetical protein
LSRTEKLPSCSDISLDKCYALDEALHTASFTITQETTEERGVCCKINHKYSETPENALTTSHSSSFTAFFCLIISTTCINPSLLSS